MRILATIVIAAALLLGATGTATAGAPGTDARACVKAGLAQVARDAKQLPVRKRAAFRRAGTERVHQECRGGGEPPEYRYEVTDRRGIGSGDIAFFRYCERTTDRVVDVRFDSRTAGRYGVDQEGQGSHSVRIELDGIPGTSDQSPVYVTTVLVCGRSS